MSVSVSPFAHPTRPVWLDEGTCRAQITFSEDVVACVFHVSCGARDNYQTGLVANVLRILSNTVPYPGKVLLNVIFLSVAAASITTPIYQIRARYHVATYAFVGG